MDRLEDSQDGASRMEWQEERLVGKWEDKQVDRQEDRQKDKQVKRQKDRQEDMQVTGQETGKFSDAGWTGRRAGRMDWQEDRQVDSKWMG